MKGLTYFLASWCLVLVFVGNVYAFKFRNLREKATYCDLVGAQAGLILIERELGTISTVTEALDKGQEWCNETTKNDPKVRQKYCKQIIEEAVENVFMYPLSGLMDSERRRRIISSIISICMSKH